MRFLEGKGVRVWGRQGLKGLLDIGLAVFVIAKSDCRLLAYFSHVYISIVNIKRNEALSDQIKTADDNGPGKTEIADVVHDRERHRPTKGTAD